MSFRVDVEVSRYWKLSGSELTRRSRIRFMRWVLHMITPGLDPENLVLRRVAISIVSRIRQVRDAMLLLVKFDVPEPKWTDGPSNNLYLDHLIHHRPNYIIHRIL
jgi:hypothetical protein